MAGGWAAAAGSKGRVLGAAPGGGSAGRPGPGLPARAHTERLLMWEGDLPVHL